MFDVITIGETMAAFTPDTLGPLRYVKEFSMKIAGAESNMAIGLAKLNCRVSWMSRLGQDEFGYYIRNVIRGEGVDTSQVIFDCENPTGLMFKESGTGETAVQYYRKGSAASKISRTDLPEEYLQQASILFLTGITPVLSDSCRDMAIQMIEYAEKNEILFGFDPNIRRRLWENRDFRPLLADMVLRSQIVLIGLEEADLLFGINDPFLLCNKLYYEGSARWIAVKNGGEGAWVSEKNEGKVYTIPPYSCRCIDPIGAGDAFNAGFLKGIISGLPVEICGTIGAVTGALATENIGDFEGYPDWDKIEKILSGGNMIYR